LRKADGFIRDVLTAFVLRGTLGGLRAAQCGQAFGKRRHIHIHWQSGPKPYHPTEQLSRANIWYSLQPQDGDEEEGRRKEVTIRDQRVVQDSKIRRLTEDDGVVVRSGIKEMGGQDTSPSSVVVHTED